MSIDSTRPITPLTPIQGSEIGTVQPQKNKSGDSGAIGGQTQVNLSDAQARLHQASSEDIDSAKVESLKAAIRNGDLKVDTGKIADALIAQTQSMLNGQD
ncbi:flagellar biosynthesis anti-sigma factor FlgM [Martelella alba]|uniref:Negative regulator of flagellin synthesis n=1 Tax=Martelella alba TaxID=2590451 RepID=A0ABY2SS98_9HYPH|nr:flagellar biosynthesis anti-sigma factor FlgM [Martelella alba]TKI08300.1 anti-sigma-28 factor FlgM [Martelella alba]